MTAPGAVERPSVPISAAAAYVVGLGGLAFTLTILWLSMRLVLDIGGFCASGGPYVIGVVCPDEVLALMPLSIFGLFIFGGLAAWAGPRLGGGWVALIYLGWPALFLSLGWNFLDYGLWPPGGAPGEIVWAWVVCAVVFGLMGGLPLVLWLRGSALPSMGRRGPAGEPVFIDARGLDAGELDALGLGALIGLKQAVRDAQASSTGRPDDAGNADIATRLERLASLHRAGDLTDAEFEAAKRTTLDGSDA